MAKNKLQLNIEMSNFSKEKIKFLRENAIPISEVFEELLERADLEYFKNKFS